MTKYLKITELEFLRLKDISDSMVSMMGAGCEDFDNEARRGEKSINSIMKRAGLKRKENEYQDQDIKI